MVESRTIRRAASEQAQREARLRFRVLLLANPNYFGNLVESPFEPVLPIQGNTFYEDLGCLGYHPQQEQLEAVVYVNQPSGYLGTVCDAGSLEYVRFYLSFDLGATWQDQGLTSFRVWDVPEGTQGSRRLEFAASLKVDPKRKFCVTPQTIQARAILSWNNPPPANQPNWVPVWGTVRTESILVEPIRFIFPLELLEIAKAKLTPELKEALDLETPIAATPKALAVPELARLYRDKGVPTHRFAYRELMQLVAQPAAPQSVAALLGDLKLDPDIFDLLFPKADGDISFEELRCIGLDPNHPDTLVGVIQVKKPSGYSGGPCTDGSREYVTFWADLDGNGSFETCLGTAHVRVYDLPNLPPPGLYYAVRLPVDLAPYRKPCADGPTVLRIRAILSWNVPVPCANPNYVPTWGNREETLIHVAPREAIVGVAGKIAILGGIPTQHIDDVSGLTTATAVFATNNQPPDLLNRPCPFAARVTVQGAPVLNHTYAVEVSPNGFVWTPVLTELIVTDQNGNTSTHTANAITNRFAYLPFTQNVNGLLAQWDTTGDAKWFVRLSVFDGGGTLVSTDTHALQLDNTSPEATIDITAGTGNCGKFDVGAVITGNFVARDTYLGSYSISVEPAVNPPGVGIPSPSSGTVQTAPAPGDGWTLDTTGMQPCGYVIRVVAVDRAIVNSQSVGHHTPDSAGFCLEEPQP